MAALCPTWAGPGWLAPVRVWREVGASKRPSRNRGYDFSTLLHYVHLNLITYHIVCIVHLTFRQGHGTCTSFCEGAIEIPSCDCTSHWWGARSLSILAKWSATTRRGNTLDHGRACNTPQRMVESLMPPQPRHLASAVLAPFLRWGHRAPHAVRGSLTPPQRRPASSCLQNIRVGLLSGETGRCYRARAVVA